MFGKVLDVKENREASLSRSVFIISFNKEAVRRALTVSLAKKIKIFNNLSLLN